MPNYSKLAKGLSSLVRGEDEAANLIGRAAESAGQRAPVTASKPLTDLQDFHTSLGDEIRRRAVEAKKQMDSWDYKYDKGQRVFTEDSAKKNRAPYEIVERTRHGYQPMREDHPTLGPGMGKVIKDPETGKAMRTPYEPGYRVRGEVGEMILPESAIKGDVEFSKGGALRMQAGGLSALANIGKAGTKLSKAEMATTPKQFISEEYLTNLQKEGYKDGGDVTPSFTQRLQSAMERHMAAGGQVDDNTTPDMTDGGQINYGGQYKKGGNVHMPITSLKQVKPRQYAEAGYVDPLGAPDYEPSKGVNMVELAGRMIKDQAKKEGAVLSTPEGRRDVALKVASHMPGLGMGGDLVSLADWVQTLIPGLYEEKPTSVLDTKKAAAPYRDVRELQRVPKFPLRNVIGSPTGEEFQDKFKEMGIQGENEAPVTEFAASLFAPGAAMKAPRKIEGGLNAVTAAARRPFTPATATVEAVSPDLAKFKNPAFQDYATKQMIGEGSAVPMTTMGGRKTTQRPGQGVYLNEANELEYNPMLGVTIPRAGNLSTNKALRADIATAGQELGQEAMAAHRFVPMATNNIKDASSMMIKGPGGRPLTNKEVLALANELPNMIATHSPANGGLLVAPFSMTKGEIPADFLKAQSVASKVLGKDAKIQFGKSDPNKDLMYMPRSTYVEESGRGTSQAAQAVRNKLKRMDKNFSAQ